MCHGNHPPAQGITHSRGRHGEDLTRYCPMCGRDAVAEIRRGEHGFCSEEHAEAYLVEVGERAVRAKES